MLDLKLVAAADPEVAAAMELELGRQRDHIELIASENFVSPAVMAAMGSHLTNKYAEGYPGKRYYGGCQYVDIVENLARDRACELFGAEHANVQPHSGAQANIAVYFGLLKPGDTILGMNLSHGGHLTHGSPVNLSGKYFNILPYGVSEQDERIDYDEVRRLALEHKPQMLLAGASAYPRTIDFARLGERGLFQNSGGVVTALISRDEYYAQRSERFVQESFSGSLPAFMAAFTSRKRLSEQEIDELQALIDKMRG